MSRMIIAKAALVAVSKSRLILEADVTGPDRQYFYATPDGVGRHSVSRLSAELERTNCATLVNWDRGDRNYGLKYVHKDYPVSEALMGYQGDEARDEWRAWSSKTAIAKNVLKAAARNAINGQDMSYLNDQKCLTLESKGANSVNDQER